GASLKTRENPLKRGIKHPSNWGIAIPQNRGTQKTLLQKKKEKIIRQRILMFDSLSSISFNAVVYHS
ncbi:hypothetical protein ECMT8_23135, partial [Escherichia coli CUMT8]